jgi:hypothetical protein
MLDTRRQTVHATTGYRPRAAGVVFLMGGYPMSDSERQQTLKQAARANWAGDDRSFEAAWPALREAMKQALEQTLKQQQPADGPRIKL